nr:MAG TPA: hypothetical protein [Caudoviricetes sp.]
MWERTQQSPKIPGTSFPRTSTAPSFSWID